MQITHLSDVKRKEMSISLELRISGFVSVGGSVISKFALQASLLSFDPFCCLGKDLRESPFEDVVKISTRPRSEPASLMSESERVQLKLIYHVAKGTASRNGMLPCHTRSSQDQRIRAAYVASRLNSVLD